MWFHTFIYYDHLHEHGKLDKFLLSLLLFASILLQYLAVGALPGKLPRPCPYLTFLSISIYFTSPEESSTAQCLLRSSPALQELEVAVSCFFILYGFIMHCSFVDLKISNQPYSRKCWFGELFCRHFLILML